MNKTYAATEANLSKAPDSPGVYALFEGGEIIYIGRALTSMRGRTPGGVPGAKRRLAALQRSRRLIDGPEPVGAAGPAQKRP